MHAHSQSSTFLRVVGAAEKPECAQGALLGDTPLMDSPRSLNTKSTGETPRSPGLFQKTWDHYTRRQDPMLDSSE